MLLLVLFADTSWQNNISTKYDFLKTQKQTEWPIKSVMHSFHSVLMKGAAILDLEVGGFRGSADFLN